MKFKKETKKISTFVFLISVLVSLLVLIISFVLPPKHRVTSKIMVIQKLSEDSSLNPYTASQSAKYSAQVLAEIVGTRAFVEEVLSRGKILYSEKDIESATKKKIKAKIVKDTEIVETEIFDSDPEIAKKLGDIVNELLKEKAADLDKDSESLELKVIDPPTVPGEKYSPKPFYNFSISLGSLLVLSIIIVLLL